MYAWQECENGERARTLEERRTAILEQLEEGSDSAVQESLLTEWLELVKERDRLLREEVDEANDRVKLECLADLRRVLKDLGGLTYGGCDEDVSLRRDLATLYHQVESFCEEHSISTEQEEKETQPEVVYCPIPPPPPLPPPPPPASLNLRKRAAAKEEQNGSTDDASADSSSAPPAKKMKVPGTPVLSQQTPFRHESPLQSFNRHLIMSISGGLVKRQLKRTSGARSPGGTPLKKARTLDANDPADAIAIALQKKFQNVPVRSPLTPCEESRGDMSNLSENFGSPSLQSPKRPTETASETHSPVAKENVNGESLVNTI